MIRGADRYKGGVVLCLLAVFILDMLLPLGVAIGVLYIVAFYFATRISARAIGYYAAVCVVLVLVKLLFFVSAETGWMVYFNRLLSVVAIVVVAVFAIRRRKLADQINWERETYIRVLRQKNERLQTYKRSLNLHLLMSVIGKDGLISFANQPQCALSGYAVNELIGRSFYNTCELASEARKEIENTVNSGAAWRGEIKSKTKDGLNYWCDTTIFPISDGSESAGKFFVISLPITERKLLEMEQEQNLRTFETILWQVSHKLRAPIATCKGITYLIEKEGAVPDNEVEQMALKNRKRCTHELEQFSREIIEIIEASHHRKATTIC